MSRTNAATPVLIPPAAVVACNALNGCIPAAHRLTSALTSFQLNLTLLLGSDPGVSAPSCLDLRLLRAVCIAASAPGFSVLTSASTNSFGNLLP